MTCVEADVVNKMDQNASGFLRDVVDIQILPLDFSLLSLMGLFKSPAAFFIVIF
jgi:hypothetical protein